VSKQDQDEAEKVDSEDQIDNEFLGRVKSFMTDTMRRFLEIHDEIEEVLETKDIIEVLRAVSIMATSFKWPVN
jgi:hypothetical protein